MVRKWLACLFVEAEVKKGINRKIAEQSTCFGFIGRAPHYCTSRDALKAIRPEGWSFKLHNGGKGYKKWLCEMHHPDDALEVMCRAYLSSTEELAELYAILQAISYDRNTKG